VLAVLHGQRVAPLLTEVIAVLYVLYGEVLTVYRPDRWHKSNFSAYIPPDAVEEAAPLMVCILQSLYCTVRSRLLPLFTETSSWYGPYVQSGLRSLRLLIL
jgi:hypothetical protein